MSMRDLDVRLSAVIHRENVDLKYLVRLSDSIYLGA